MSVTKTLEKQKINCSLYITATDLVKNTRTCSGIHSGVLVECIKMQPAGLSRDRLESTPLWECLVKNYKEMLERFRLAMVNVICEYKSMLERIQFHNSSSHCTLTCTTQYEENHTVREKNLRILPIPQGWYKSPAICFY